MLSADITTEPELPVEYDSEDTNPPFNTDKFPATFKSTSPAWPAPVTTVEIPV
jgi:hypothetical protein